MESKKTKGENITGLLQLELHLPAAQSLKQKRSVIKSLKDRLRSRYNISVAEVGHMDKWQRATLAIAMVSNDRNHLESRFESISHFIDEEIMGYAFVTGRELVFL